eukprot:10180609-Alexandrium_andersonii.AAC.1
MSIEPNRSTQPSPTAPPCSRAHCDITTTTPDVVDCSPWDPRLGRYTSREPRQAQPGRLYCTT